MENSKIAEQTRLLKDKLFRQWQPTLERNARELGLPRAAAIWKASERLLGRLKQYDADVRDGMIESIYTDLCASSFGQPREAAIEIMAVLYSQLCDAIPEGGVATHPYLPICMAMVRAMSQEDLEFFKRLCQDLVSRPTDNWGNKVVLPVEDYLEEAQPEELYVEEEQQNSKTITPEFLYKEAIGQPDINSARLLQLVLADANCPEWSNKVTEYFKQQEQNRTSTFIVTNNGPVNGNIHEQSIGITSPASSQANKALTWKNNNSTNNG